MLGSYHASVNVAPFCTLKDCDVDVFLVCFLCHNIKNVYKGFWVNIFVHIALLIPKCVLSVSKK